MNIICNNCVGARLYEVTHQQFPNPFMWMSIMEDDFIKLVKEYDEIDLNNPKFELERYKSNDYDSVLVTLDNDIKLHYIHYIQDSTKDIPVKEKNTNILYKDAIEYCRSKWFSRLNRSTEEPVFLYSFNYMPKENAKYMDILKRLLAIDNRKLMILVHEGIEMPSDVKDNIMVKYCSTDVMELNGGALANALKEKIFAVENV